jgi:hypothetical protein
VTSEFVKLLTTVMGRVQNIGENLRFSFIEKNGVHIINLQKYDIFEINKQSLDKMQYKF